MKCLGQVRNVLLCGLGSLGAGVLLTGLLGLPAYQIALFVAAGLLGSGIGAVTLEKSQKWMIGLLSGGMVVTVVAGMVCLRDGFAAILLTVLYALTAGASVLGGFGYYGPTGWWCLVILALAYLTGQDNGILLGAMLLAIVLTLDGFRDSAMRKAQLQDRYVKRLNNPSGILGYSILLLGIMLPVLLGIGLLAMLLGDRLTGALGKISLGSAHGASKLLYWLNWLITAFLEWFRSLFRGAPEKQGGTGGGGDDYVPDIYTGGPGSWLLTILLVAATAVLLLSVAAGAGTVLLRQMKRPREEAETQDYIDEVEQLERPARKRRKLFERKQRMEDFESPSMKIRFAFQQLLRRRGQTEPMAYTKTPNELREQDKADANAVINAYNRVKYGTGGVTEQELQAARRYVKGK